MTVIYFTFILWISLKEKSYIYTVSKHKCIYILPGFLLCIRTGNRSGQISCRKILFSLNKVSSTSKYLVDRTFSDIKSLFYFSTYG